MMTQSSLLTAEFGRSNWRITVSPNMSHVKGITGVTDRLTVVPRIVPIEYALRVFIVKSLGLKGDNHKFLLVLDGNNIDDSKHISVVPGYGTWCHRRCLVCSREGVSSIDDTMMCVYCYNANRVPDNAVFPISYFMRLQREWKFTSKTANNYYENLYKRLGVRLP